MATNITRKPSPGPKNLRIERGEDGTHDTLLHGTITASWGNPADALDDSNHKWACVDSKWVFQASKDMSKSLVEQRGTAHPTGDNIWVRDQGTADSHTVWYDRRAYHPFKEGRYLQSVKADVFAINTKGQTHANVSMTFRTPRAPEIADIELDPDTGTMSTTITTDPGEDSYERYDTRWYITRVDSANLNTDYRTERVWGDAATSTDEEIEVSRQIAAASALVPGQWMKLTVHAYARGIAGNSKEVTKSYMVAPPAQASISSIVKSDDTGQGIVTVRIKTNASSTAPVDSVTLYRIADTQIASAITMAEVDVSEWEEVASDDGSCTGLCDLVSDARPSNKRHTWYMVLTERGAVKRRSVPVEAKCLYHATDATTDDSVTFISVAPNDSSSIALHLGWDTDDSTTTQVSWSEHEDAWESTDQPTNFDVAWEDDSPATGFQHSAWLYVRGLDEGVPYYVRARRSIDEQGIVTASPWCFPANNAPVVPSSTPSEPVLSVPAIVARGQSVGLSWSFAAGNQVAWQVMQVIGSERREVASSEDANTSCSIPPESYGDATSLTLVVMVTAGGDWVESDEATVTIADAPTCEVGVVVGQSGKVESQPVTFAVSTDCAKAQMVLTVTSRGNFTHAPGGEERQAAGDVVWATALTPDLTWSSDVSAWATTVTAPADLVLRDGATYDVDLVATDPDTLLSSGTAGVDFTVDWSHKAVCPDGTVVVDRESMSATITPSAPSGAAQTDVCDIYRLTVDGPYLIASDVPFGTPMVDPVAPFSDAEELAYRLATRTADGDVDFRDVPYELRWGHLRIDFGERSVDLPFNLELADAFKKGFEARAHLDGKTAGYWDSAVSRTSTFSTDLMRLDRDQRSLVSELARHVGPCFVRTPVGSAYEADMQVGNISDTYNTSAVGVSINATEVRLTESYLAVPEGYGEEGE